VSRVPLPARTEPRPPGITSAPERRATERDHRDSLASTPQSRYPEEDIPAGSTSPAARPRARPDLGIGSRAATTPRNIAVTGAIVCPP
jgi:hypothetical protein